MSTDFTTKVAMENNGPPPNTLLFFNRLKERVDATPSNRPVPGKVVSKSANISDPFSPIINFPSSGTYSSQNAPPSIATSSTTSNNTNASTNGNNNALTAPIKARNTADATSPSGQKQKLTDRKNAPYRITQFENILYADVVDMTTLRKLCWNGIPNQYRPVAWPLLLNYHPTRKERRDDTVRRKRQEYQDMIPIHYDLNHPSNFPDSEAEQTSFEGKTWRQIAVDLPRTCPDQPFFHQQPVRKALERILYIWSVRHPASGYVQGMNDLLTPIMLTCCQAFVEEPTRCDTTSLGGATMSLIEADSYWCFSNLMDNIQDHYTFSQPGLQRMISRLEDLIIRTEKDLHDHFITEELMYVQFAFRWMNCVLLRELPLHCVFRLWDTYFSEERGGFENFHVYVCVALLKSFKDQLMKMNFQELITFLQALPTEDWEEEDIEPLLSQAFILSTLFEHSPSHLQNIVGTTTFG